MKKVASLRYGVVFKKAFCDPKIFSAFVHDLLDIDFEVEHVETEKSFDPPIGRVLSRFDLFAEDSRNRVIVDIQHARYRDHYDRFLHYHCAALLEQIINAENYRPVLKVFTIVVLTSGDHHQTDVSTIDFDPKDLKGNSLGEIPHKIIYVCPKYINDDTPEPYREWMQAIEDSLDGEVEESNYHQPEILKIFDHIEKDRISAEERAKMIDEYDEDELRQDTFKKGLKEGLDEGREEGRKEGIRQDKIETAKKMLSKGLDVVFIAEITGLLAEEIQKLKS